MTMSSFLSLCNAVLKISNFRLGLHILTSCTIIFARDIPKSSRNTHYSTNTRFISNYPDLNFNTFFPLNKKVNPFKKKLFNKKRRDWNSFGESISYWMVEASTPEKNYQCRWLRYLNASVVCMRAENEQIGIQHLSVIQKTFDSIITMSSTQNQRDIEYGSSIIYTHKHA